MERPAHDEWRVINFSTLISLAGWCERGRHETEDSKRGSTGKVGTLGKWDLRSNEGAVMELIALHLQVFFSFTHLCASLSN